MGPPAHKWAYVLKRNSDFRFIGKNRRVSQASQHRCEWNDSAGMINNCRDRYFGQRVTSGKLPKQVKLVARESILAIEQLKDVLDEAAAWGELVQTPANNGDVDCRRFLILQACAGIGIRSENEFVRSRGNTRQIEEASWNTTGRHC